MDGGLNGRMRHGGSEESGVQRKISGRGTGKTSQCMDERLGKLV